MEKNHPFADNSAQQYSTNADAQKTQVIPVIEEFATVHNEVMETGKVTIRKTVSEETAVVNLPITNESYDIQRVPVGEMRDTPPPAVRYEGDVMIIPVTKEITVVQKRYEVVEELRITRRVTETPNMQEITLMKEHVEVARKRHNDDAPERF